MRDPAQTVREFFVPRDGRITRWTEYWHLSLPAKMMSGEDVAALVPAGS